MALGSNDGFPNDVDDIKNSLRLLKSKQPQKHSNNLHESDVLYKLNRTVITALMHQRLLKDRQILPKVLTFKFRLFHIRISKLQLSSAENYS